MLSMHVDKASFAVIVSQWDPFRNPLKIHHNFSSMVEEYLGFMTHLCLEVWWALKTGSLGPPSQGTAFLYLPILLETFIIEVSQSISLGLKFCPNHRPVSVLQHRVCLGWVETAHAKAKRNVQNPKRKGHSPVPLLPATNRLAHGTQVNRTLKLKLQTSDMWGTSQLCVSTNFNRNTEHIVK